MGMLVYMKDLSHYSRKIGQIIINFNTAEMNDLLKMIFQLCFLLAAPN